MALFTFQVLVKLTSARVVTSHVPLANHVALFVGVDFDDLELVFEGTYSGARGISTMMEIGVIF